MGPITSALEAPLWEGAGYLKDIVGEPTGY